MFTNIIRDRHGTLRGIVLGVQVAPNFGTMAPKYQTIALFSPNLTACCAPSIRHRQNISVGPRTICGSLLNTMESSRPNPAQKILWLAELGTNAFGPLFRGFFQSSSPYELEVCEIYVAYLYGYNKRPSRNFAWYIFGGPGSPQFWYNGPQISNYCAFFAKFDGLLCA